VTVDDLGNVATAYQSRNRPARRSRSPCCRPTTDLRSPRRTQVVRRGRSQLLHPADRHGRGCRRDSVTPPGATRAVTLVLKLTDGAGNPVTTAGTLTVRRRRRRTQSGNGTFTGNGTAQVTLTDRRTTSRRRCETRWTALHPGGGLQRCAADGGHVEDHGTAAAGPA